MWRRSLKTRLGGLRIASMFILADPRGEQLGRRTEDRGRRRERGTLLAADGTRRVPATRGHWGRRGDAGRRAGGGGQRGNRWRRTAHGVCLLSGGIGGDARPLVVPPGFATRAL